MLYLNTKDWLTLHKKILVKFLDESTTAGNLILLSHKLKQRGSYTLVENLPATVVMVAKGTTHCHVGDTVLVNPWNGKDTRINGILYCLVEPWAIEALIPQDEPTR